MLSCEHLAGSTIINICKRTCRECGSRGYISKGWCANVACVRALVSGKRTNKGKKTRARSALLEENKGKRTRARDKGQENKGRN
jgi:hypothetical protein